MKELEHMLNDIVAKIKELEARMEAGKEIKVEYVNNEIVH